MPQDRSPLDHLPDDGGPDVPSGRRQKQIVLALLSLLLVVGAVVVLVLLTSQRDADPGETGPSAPTSTPSGPGGTPTATADLDTALADLDSSRSTLESAVVAADELLRVTDGKVADPASRAGLVDALTVAQSALDADVDRTSPGGVQAATTRLRATTATLQHAAGIVADSHEEWVLQQQAPPTSTPVTPAPGPTLDPIPLPTDPGVGPGPVTPPDRTPRPGPEPIPIPDDQR